MGYDYAIAGNSISADMEAAELSEVTEVTDAVDSSDNAANFGIVPIVLPHKNRARYVFALNDFDRSEDHAPQLYQVIESNNTTVLGGALGFISSGFFAFGAGCALQLSRDYTSVRVVSGRETAYHLPELTPPKSVDDVAAWSARYTNVAYSSIRSFKILAGVYAIAHAGSMFEIEGVWQHRVIKENDTISLYLTLKKQKRLKLTAGVAPVLMNNIDLAHNASQTQMVFQFKNIDIDPKARQMLHELLTSTKKSVLQEAINMAEEYESLDIEPSVAFTTEKIREEKESRQRMRLRVPLLTSHQKIGKKRDRSEEVDHYFAGKHYKTSKQVSEVIQRYESQRPIDYLKWHDKSQIYPNRMRFNYKDGFNWPLDYKNKKIERITQIINIENGEVGKSYQTSGVRFLWTVTDNYITKEKFLTIHKQIGQETGLLPLMFNETDLPDFSGPPTRADDHHESMMLSLQLSIRDFEKTKIYQNIIEKPFLEYALHLFDKYCQHTDGDYLHLSDLYSNKDDFQRLYRNILEDKVRAVVNKANEINKSIANNNKSRCFGLFHKKLSAKDKMHLERKLWHKLQADPFILLAAINGTMPDCSYRIKGTSANLERKIETALARDIMLNTAVVPMKYQPTLAITTPPVVTTPSTIEPIIAPIHFDSYRYYSESFIEFLNHNRLSNAVVVVTSWSDGALQFPRSPYIGSRQSRDLPHHLLLAQKLKQQGIHLKIYYLAFDNTLHFNHKDKRAVDNTLLPAFKNYLLSFGDTELDEDQLETIYLNPQYKEKSGDIIIDALPQVRTLKGNALSLTGKNALQLQDLKNKLDSHRSKGDYLIGMTAHSTGEELSKFSSYLGIEVIGCSQASLPLGTKEGNKKLFELADVPYVYGSTKAQKNLDDLYADCVEVAAKTTCKRLMIKHNSSSAGKGNLIVNISSCYDTESGICDADAIKEKVYDALIHYRHPDKDKDLVDGCETFYIRKIRELGAIVEEMKEAEKVVSPGSLAIVNQDGTIDVEYIYDQILTGKDGQNFGGSLGPSCLSDEDIAEMQSLTEQVGRALYSQGALGYFGLDFLKCDDEPLIVIEANLRKTGTRYPYMFVNHLVGENKLKEKFLFHDDNIHIPMRITDLPGRNYGLQHYMSSFYMYLQYQPIHYSNEKGSGVIVSFDTHSAGKIGVLSIGETREHALKLNQDFRDFIEAFSYQYYPRVALATQNYGLSLIEKGKFSPPIELRDGILNQKNHGLVYGLREPLTTKSNWLTVQRHKFDSTLNKAPKRIGKLLTSMHDFGSKIVPSDEDEDSDNKIIGLSRSDSEEKFSPPVTGDEMVIAIFGRTRTSDYILLEAAKRGIRCYRINEESNISLPSETNKGYVTGVSIPLINPRTGKYKIYFDEDSHQLLPTVIYNYDFSSERRLLAHDRGSKIFFDDSQLAHRKLAKLQIPYFNQFNKQWLKFNYLSPLRSQLILSHILETHCPELFALYPTTIALSNHEEASEQIMQFISENNSFYIKRSLNIHDSAHKQLEIFAFKKDTDLIFKYYRETMSENGKIITPMYYKTALAKLTTASFYEVVNYIKQKMDVAHNVQYILQTALEQPVITDKQGRSLSAKLRVVTLHDKDSREVNSSSIYGVYGGKNAFLGYVGDPAIYIDACQFANYFPSADRKYIEAYIQQIAIKSHMLIEKSMSSFLGEVVTDILISPEGIMPLKVNIKPERLNLDFIRQQTYYGEYLEGSEEARNTFLQRIERQELTRTNLILDTFEFLHKEAKPTQVKTEKIEEDETVACAI